MSVWGDKRQGSHQIKCQPEQVSMAAICLRKGEKHNFLRCWEPLPVSPTLQKSKMEGNAMQLDDEWKSDVFNSGQRQPDL